MNPFIRKLRHSSRLSEHDEGVLEELTAPIRRIERRGDILQESMEDRSIILILDGWACRYKHLENGKRQISSILLPGDLTEPFGAAPLIMDHSLGALTPVAFARMKPTALRNAVDGSPDIARAFWWDLLLADAITRERLVSLGRRTATERLGHVFCELHVRLTMVGLAANLSYDMPLRQLDLADMLGLSDVHLNRSLQDLRRMGLLSLEKRQLVIHDLEGLREVSMFDPTYLQRTVAL